MQKNKSKYGFKPLAKLGNRLFCINIIIFLVLSLLIPLTIIYPQQARAAALPAYRYTKTFDTTSGQASGISVASDSQGNIYVTGTFQGGTVVFDGTGGGDSKTSTNKDVFVTKYNANGSYGFTKIFDVSSAGADGTPSDITTDAEGNIYITGLFEGTVTFDGLGGHDTFTTGIGGSKPDTFLTKYNSNGSYAYTKVFDTSGLTTGTTGNSVDTDSQGNVYIVGQWSGTIGFDGPGGSDIKSTTNNNTFLTKYNADGTYGNTRIFDVQSGSSTPGGLAIDTQNNIYIAGVFNGQVVFDGLGGSDSKTGSGSFLTKIDAAGSYVYTKTSDASGGSVDGASVTTDTQGNIFVTGAFANTVVFDGPGGSDTRSSPNNDGYLTKYNADGSYGFTKIFFDQIGFGNNSLPLGVDTDIQGNVYLTGLFRGTVTFDGAGGNDSQTDAGGNESAFLTRFNANGTYGWTRIFDTSLSAFATAEASAVAIDPIGNAYFTGDFADTIGFDGVGGSDIQTSGSRDSFLTSYQVFIPSQPGAQSSPVPGAPNTGFGSFINTAQFLKLTCIGALSIAVLAVISARYMRLYRD
ncbi:MAG TPA: hypothetical protein VLF79_03170 [Candidatus Saccharimonadales bacterium]|nr:hypothetical protein [Candidatus Saccharimonadales bacterium]